MRNGCAVPSRERSGASGDAESALLQAESNTAEGDKVGHVLEEIADDAFNLLMYKGCSTGNAINKECRQFEQVKSHRILQTFARLSNTAATSTCEDQSTPQRPLPPGNLTRIVRRELEAMAPSSFYSRSTITTPVTAALVQAIVRQEFENIGVRLFVAVLQRYTSLYHIGLIGSILLWVGILASAWSPNIATITITLGFIHGFGAGIVLMCNLVEIMQYFQKYRDIASGIKFAADPMSAIVFPALLSYLRATYGLRGALLIYAALSMHVMAFSIVLKEPQWLKRDRMESPVSRYPQKEARPVQSSKAVKICHMLRQMPHPLLKPSFYAVVTGSVLLDYVNAVHLSTLVDYALDSGVSRAHAELTVTYASAPEILGRVLLPLVADVGLVRRTTLTAGNAFVLGCLLLLTPQTSSATHVVVRAASSVALATLMTMKHVLVADYYGTDAVALLSGASGVLLVPVLLTNPSIIGKGTRTFTLE
ncbi:hypothetical protein HPB51_023461 [Rhipicephalus microplus]|uniref:Monocarboxylate transporter n=1 Tax=Rhipicephalus microplus TaxID=6941 RepID=A0A9J6F8E0_RHIMP|nr:hypothetical protein HPB51_023461 [Rhipicephalus microplus]